jgi:hypothetical protein
MAKKVKEKEVVTEVVKEVVKVEPQPDYKVFITELRTADKWTHEGIEALIQKHKINEK